MTPSTRADDDGAALGRVGGSVVRGAADCSPELHDAARRVRWMTANQANRRIIIPALVHLSTIRLSLPADLGVVGLVCVFRDRASAAALQHTPATSRPARRPDAHPCMVDTCSPMIPAPAPTKRGDDER